MANYDTSTPGMPYIRANRITIDFPPPGSGNPVVSIEQRKAVKLTDGTSATIDTLPTISHEIPFDEIATVSFEIVDLDTDTSSGQIASLPQLVGLLASYVRYLQKQHNS